MVVIVVLEVFVGCCELVVRLRVVFMVVILLYVLVILLLRCVIES